MHEIEDPEPSLLRGSDHNILDGGPDMERSIRRVQPWIQRVTPGGHQAKRARVENIIKVMSGSDLEQGHMTRSDGTRVKQSGEGRSAEDDNGPSSKHHRWRNTRTMNYLQSKPENIRVMADVLKAELSRAVSRSVDSVFKSMTGSAEESVDEETTAGLLLTQPAEALSLVVDDRRQACPQSRDYQPAPPTFQGLPHERLWSSARVRMKVNSRSVQGPAMEQMIWGNLYHPHIKAENDSMLKNLYLPNECLTTKHLKKAKLMFFFTRYPSSVVLRMCFHDVQFTRCISSQLIKWFSNFREFFYIQMEKFARRAVAEGRPDLYRPTVGRESELFRTLNVHYNKANDFQVPDHFLEVAEITLREFCVAISVGKDGDPSWKKAIYKVICKLDSEVPAEFKSLG